MNHNYSFVFLFTSILLSLAAGGCKPVNPTPGVGAPYPEVHVPRSEIRQLHSSETGRDYELYIRLPDESEKYPKAKYPVLYLLDAQWDFKMMDSIYGSLKYDGFIPEVIIVGITYAGDKPDYETLRAKDFTPVYTGNVPGSGDAPKFLAFLKDKVIRCGNQLPGAANGTRVDGPFVWRLVHPVRIVHRTVALFRVCVRQPGDSL
jgi:hypothetical protein